MWQREAENRADKDKGRGRACYFPAAPGRACGGRRLPLQRFAAGDRQLR
jgi:hypothetical protein